MKPSEKMPRLVQLAHTMICTAIGILGWFGFCYAMRKIQSQAVCYFLNPRPSCRMTPKELREKKVMRAIITRTFDVHQDSSEILIRQTMNIVRQQSKTWNEDVASMCLRAEETSISETFYILIKEMAKAKRNKEHIFVIYTLFFDVVTEIEASDEVSELNKLRHHLIEFYGTASPLFDV